MEVTPLGGSLSDFQLKVQYKHKGGQQWPALIEEDF
jgi:hypothetical protein